MVDPSVPFESCTSVPLLNPHSPESGLPPAVTAYSCPPLFFQLVSRLHQLHSVSKGEGGLAAALVSRVLGKVASYTDEHRTMGKCSSKGVMMCDMVGAPRRVG